MFGKRHFRNVIPSEALDLFRWRVRRRVFGSEKRETPYRGKTVGGASYKRLSEGGGKGVLFLLEMREAYPLKSTKI